MDHPQFQQHGGPNTAEHRPHRRPIHHTAFFWVAAFCLLIAMGIFVFSDGFALWPGTKPVPGLHH
jgi:hypothetical protein